MVMKSHILRCRLFVRRSNFPPRVADEKFSSEYHQIDAKEDDLDYDQEIDEIGAETVRAEQINTEITKSVTTTTII